MGILCQVITKNIPCRGLYTLIWGGWEGEQSNQQHVGISGK